MIHSSVVPALLVWTTQAFVLPAAAGVSRSRPSATEADVEAIASRVDCEAKVQELFLVDGEPRRFLRRQQFYDKIAALPGTGSVSDEGLLEFWIYFGGAPPREVDKKKSGSSKGFFGAFADTLKQNAMGTVDDRPKDAWGDTKPEMTIIDANTMLESDLGRAGFTPEAYKEAFLDAAVIGPTSR